MYKVFNKTLQRSNKSQKSVQIYPISTHVTSLSNIAHPLAHYPFVLFAYSHEQLSPLPFSLKSTYFFHAISFSHSLYLHVDLVSKRFIKEAKAHNDSQFIFLESHRQQIHLPLLCQQVKLHFFPMHNLVTPQVFVLIYKTVKCIISYILVMTI